MLHTSDARPAAARTPLLPRLLTTHQGMPPLTRLVMTVMMMMAAMAAALPLLSPAAGLRLTSVAARTAAVPLPVTQFGAAPLPVLASKRPTTNARRMPPLGGPAPASTNRCPTTLLLVGLARLPCVGRAPPPRMPLALFACVPPVSHASVRPLLHQRRPSAFDAFRSVLNASSPPLPLLLPAALAYSPTSTTASSPFFRCVQDTYQVPPYRGLG